MTKRTLEYIVNHTDTVIGECGNPDCDGYDVTCSSYEDEVDANLK